MGKLTPKFSIHIIRYFVGLLFVFSGVVKANDPLGLAYKVQEFFLEMSLSFLDDYALYFSIFIITFEILIGVCLLFQYQIRTSIYAFLCLTFFFLFITAYAVFTDNIKSCGCFGDCFPMSPMVSFLKDLILFAVAVWFVLRLRVFKGKNNGLKRIVFGVTFIVTLWGQYSILKGLPYVDCLPYKEGKNLYADITQTPKIKADSIIIYFTYKDKKGKKITFDALHFPPDFNPDDYEYIERKDIILKKPEKYSNISNFELYNEKGLDLTLKYLNTIDNVVFVCVLDPSSLPNDFRSHIIRLDEKGKRMRAKTIFVTSDLPLLKQELMNMQFDLSQWQILQADNVLLKTFSRSNPTIYFISHGFITKKWGRKDLSSITLK